LVVGASVGFFSALGVQFNDKASILIFFLQVFLYATACGVVWIEHYLNYHLDKDFWKFMFENVFKSIRYILVVYGVMIVVLKYISSTNGEKTIGFVTTLAYPTIVVLVSIFMISYWVLVPSWEKYVSSSEVKIDVKPTFREILLDPRKGRTIDSSGRSKSARR
jgi:hypothetical protein